MRHLMALSCLADVARVLRDRDPASALFGPLPPPGPPDEHLDALRRSYRRLAAIVHPDVHPNDVRLATTTFQQLETLRAEREQAILEQRYPALPALPAPPQRARSGVRGGVGLAVRPTYVPPAPIVADFEAFATPPACPCVELARASLPRKVIFCSRGAADWAVRDFDHTMTAVIHSRECSSYRYRWPTSVNEHGFVVHSHFLSMHLSGWCWRRDVLG